jgi:alpha-tubulin suppressor-like RCC1 family protein
MRTGVYHRLDMSPVPVMTRAALGGWLLSVAACQPLPPPSAEKPAVPTPVAPGPTPTEPASQFLEHAEQVVVGHGHACARVTNGAVYCWGENSQGQLGNRSWDDSAVPVRVAGVDQATAIVGGMMHTCALLRSGRVMCWGGSLLEGAGDGSARDRMQPAVVADLEDAVELAAIDQATCARRRDASVVCWGRNLARRPYGPGPERYDLPRAVEGLRDVHQLAAGDLHLCAIQGAKRALVCLGLDHGIGDPGRYDDPLVVQRSPWTDVDALATGSGVTCFQRGGEKVWRCWGRNEHGQIDPARSQSTIDPADATAVAGSERIESFTLGWEGGCSIDRDGMPSCWTAAGPGPGERIEGIGPVRSIASISMAEQSHGCAADREGAVHCWGHGGDGALGDGGTTDRASPVRVVAPTSTEPVALRAPPLPSGRVFTADEIAAGYDETCARRKGEVWCWGDWHGRTVDDPRRTRTRPERIEGLPAKAVEVAAGFGYMCARMAGGQVWCWGANDRGQLGDGTRERRLTPVMVAGLADATALALSHDRGCALRANHHVACWSGDAPLADLPLPAERRGRIAEVALGEGHLCVRLRGGEVRCQGSNATGQLGNGEGGCVPDPDDVGCSGPRSHCKPREICARSDAFVPVVGMRDAKRLALGGGTSCALRSGGRVSCWGNGYQGRLGIGEPVASIVELATELPGLVDVEALSSNNSHTCAVLAEGRVSCWGQNVWGELGDRTTQPRYTPSAVFGLGEVTQVSAGMSHTCALRSDRSVWCWGKNDRGILGVGITEDISRLSTPHPVRS